MERDHILLSFILSNEKMQLVGGVFKHIIVKCII